MLSSITEEQLNKIADKYFPILVNWLFNSFIKIRKSSTKEDKIKQTTEYCKEFINNLGLK